MTLRQIIGWLLFTFSSISWLAVFTVVPFLALPSAEKLALAGSCYLASQVTWYASLPLLGKELIQLSKQAWARCKSRLSQWFNRAESK